MADIDIEKQKPVWPWILAAVVIVIIILLIIFVGNSPEREVAENAPMEDTAAVEQPQQERFGSNAQNIAAVEGFVTFVNDHNEEMGMSHTYSHNAIDKEIDAIIAVADEMNYTIDADLGQAREFAQDITSDPKSERHAHKLSKTFRILTNALTGLQKAHFPELANQINAIGEDVSRLEEIADNFDHDELLLDQKKTVKSYFNKSAQILKKMEHAEGGNQTTANY
ncbi:MAG TPA: hypothetical protein VK106_01145 [Balneolaceae bacterium]|nr:hypothetical protein [Balneolaceae bacterium]